MKQAIYMVTVLISMFTYHVTWSQQYKSTKSLVQFYSSAPMEDIAAKNTQAKSAFDVSSGEIVFSVPVSGFIFEKSLMQKHFNENYMESEKFPTAGFEGRLTDFDINVIGWQPARASGKMTIHGVENIFSCEGKINIQPDGLELEAVFPIELKDYKIKIPKVVFYNIAEVVEVTINFSYEKIH